MGDDTIQDVVDRLHRYADRARAAGDIDGEAAAREAAGHASNAGSLENALELEQSLQTGVFPKHKKPWWQRLFGGDDDDVSDDS